MKESFFLEQSNISFPDTNRFIMFILSGKVKIFVKKKNGQQQKIQILRV